MQELNGLVWGGIWGPYSRGDKKISMKEIVESESRFSIVIDESIIVSQKSVLIVSCCTFLERVENKDLLNIFLWT